MAGLSLGLGLGLSSPSKGVPAPYPPPPGFHWEYVTSDGTRVTSDGVFVVALVEN